MLASDVFIGPVDVGPGGIVWGFDWRLGGPGCTLLRVDGEKTTEIESDTGLIDWTEARDLAVLGSRLFTVEKNGLVKWYDLYSHGRQ